MRKKIVIFAIIFAVLLGAYFLLTKTDKKDEVNNNAEQIDTGISVNSFNPEDITKIEIVNENETFSFTKKDGLWTNEKYSSNDLSQDDINNMVSGTAMMGADTLIDDATDLASFGLDKPIATVSFTKKDNEKRTLLIGDITPSGSCRYVKMEDEKEVYTVNIHICDRYLMTLSNYRNKVLAEFNPEKVNYLLLKRGNENIELQMREATKETSFDSVWKMKSPYNCDANDTYIQENIVNKLNFTASEYVENMSASECGLSNPSYVITVKDDSDESFTINLGNEIDNCYYANVPGKNFIVKILKDNFAFIDVPTNTLYSANLFIRKIGDVKAIVFKTKDETFNMTIKNHGKNDASYKINDKEIDMDIFKNMYSVLLGLKSNGVIDSKEFGEEILSMEFTYNNNNKEKVTVRKYKERLCAVNINGEEVFYDKIDNVNNLIGAVNEAYKNPKKK